MITKLKRKTKLSSGKGITIRGIDDTSSNYLYQTPLQNKKLYNIANINPDLLLELIGSEKNNAGTIDSSKYIFRNQILNFLEKFFVIQGDNEELCDFIEEDMKILEFLKEAYKKIKECFSDFELILELKNKLTIYIVTDLVAKKAIKNLLMINKNWWSDVPSKIKEKLQIDIRYNLRKSERKELKEETQKCSIKAPHYSSSIKETAPKDKKLPSDKVDRYLYGGRFPE